MTNDPSFILLTLIQTCWWRIYLTMIRWINLSLRNWLLHIVKQSHNIYYVYSIVDLFILNPLLFLPTIFVVLLFPFLFTVSFIIWYALTYRCWYGRIQNTLLFENTVLLAMYENGYQTNNDHIIYSPTSGEDATRTWCSHGQLVPLLLSSMLTCGYKDTSLIAMATYPLWILYEIWPSLL